MRVSARIATLELAETFVISRSAQDTAEVVYVEIEHEGVTGYGEAAPIERYGESTESALAYLEEHAELLGDDPWALEEIESRLPEKEFAARAAIDAALHDLQGKLAGIPVWRLLGLSRDKGIVFTSWTIWLGSPDEMAKRAEELPANRFHGLKLKLGGGDGLDVERVRAVHDVWGGSLRVDVNEAWTLDEAIEFLPQLDALNVAYCEQPLPAGDPNGPELKRRSSIPIFVDEDCHTLRDLAACAERAHGINIKLAKSGGIREAVKMVHGAQALGLGLMLGCMVESSLGIAAAAQISSLFWHLDLDGNLLLVNDPWAGVELVDGRQLPSESPGLGVREAVPDPR